MGNALLFHNPLAAGSPVDVGAEALPAGVRWAGGKGAHLVDAVFLFCPNAANCELMAPLATNLARALCAPVYSHDYRGTGYRRDGTPTVQHMHADAQKFYDENAPPDKGGRPARILIVGISLGGSAASAVARSDVRRDVRLMTVGTFSDLRVLGRELAGVSGFAWATAIDGGRQMDSAANFARLGPNARVLVVHGTDDELIGAHHAEALYEAARGASSRAAVLLNGEGHNVGLGLIVRFAQAFLAGEIPDGFWRS